MHRFRAAVEARDHAAIVAALAQGVIFHSPVAFTPTEGRAAVGQLLGFVNEVFADFRYTDELRDGDTTALVFRARVGDREVEGIDLLRDDADGLIADFTVLIRPLSGLQALAAAMAEKVRGDGREARGEGR